MRKFTFTFLLLATSISFFFGQNLSASYEGINLTLEVNVDVSSNVATIVMSGPDEQWFAFGFDGSEMDGTYAITAENISGTTINERSLGDHNSGSVLESSITSEEVSVTDGVRTITLTLPASGSNFNFPNEESVISFIAAVGFGGNLAYHGFGNYNQGVANTATGLAFSSIVPVSWSSFELEDEKGNTVLSWKTESEINNLGFYVQHSLDARNWKDLGFIDGKNEEGSSYAFIDRETLPGVNYYRLRQVDLDGTEAFSVIKSIEIRGSKPHGDIVIFPNPVKDYLSLEMEASSEIKRVQVIDMTYKTVMDEIWSPETDKHSLNVSEFPAGHYLISIKHRDWSYTSHFVKQ